MENTKTTPATKHNLTPTEKTLSASIMLAVDLDSSFKLYSFRVITPDQYNERVTTLVNNFIDNS